MEVVFFTRNTPADKWVSKQHVEDKSERYRHFCAISQYVFHRYITSPPMKSVLNSLSRDTIVGKYSLIIGAPLTLIVASLLGWNRLVCLIPGVGGGAIWMIKASEQSEVLRNVKGLLESKDGKDHFRPEEQEIVRNLYGMFTERVGTKGAVGVCKSTDVKATTNSFPRYVIPSWAYSED